MGTKVQYTNYLPGSCTMMDLNEDANGSWSQYYDDNTSGGNLCNGYQLRPSNTYSEFDMEMLKRTILEHEAVFRKQVYELHRLYRIQKDMMDKMRRDPCRYLQAETSQSNSFSSQIPSEGTSRMFQIPHMSEANTSNQRAPLTLIDRKMPPIGFLDATNLQSAPVSNGKEITSENGDIQPTGKEIPKRAFDLQLPADVYIDCEEVERLEKEIAAEALSVTTVPHNRIQSSELETNKKLTFGAAEGLSCRENSWKSDLHARSGFPNRNLADLNEPLKELCFGRESVSVSATFLGTKSPSKETQQLWSQMTLSTSAFLKGKRSDESSSSHHLLVDGDEPIREWPFIDNKSGQSGMKQFIQGSSKEKFSAQPEQLQMNQKPNGFFTIDHNKRDTWFKPKRNLCGEVSAPFPDSSSDPFLKCTNTASSPLLSSWTNRASRNSNETFQNIGSPSNKWQYNGDLREESRLGSNVAASYQNGFIRLDYSAQPQRPNIIRRSHFGSNLEDLGPQRSQRDFHLNHTLLNGFLDRKVNERISSDSSGALSWLRKKPDFKASSLMELDLLQGYPQLKPNPNPDPRFEGCREKENKINLFNLLDLASSLQVKESTTQSNEACESKQNSKKLFGFIIPEAALPTHPTDSAQHNEKDEQNLPSLESEATFTEQEVFKSSSSNIRNHINLNSNPDSPELPREEAEVLEPPSLVSAPTAAPVIDLEAAVESETDNSEETSVREAAESIISISSQKPLHSPQGSFDTLHLLAEIAVQDTSNDEMDEFELETLALEETKPDELWRQVSELNQSDGKSSIASLLFTKQRRGQGRKRRQRREFQRDILPGLASLSRQEVTADLQTIGGLMKASGQSWQAGASRRNCGGRGLSSRGRGGRRPRSSTPTVEAFKVSPPDKAPPLVSNPCSTYESMVAWGRTTRRCRRQRFPPVTNVAAPLT